MKARTSSRSRTRGARCATGSARAPPSRSPAASRTSTIATFDDHPHRTLRARRADARCDARVTSARPSSGCSCRRSGSAARTRARQLRGFDPHAAQSEPHLHPGRRPRGAAASRSCSSELELDTFLVRSTLGYSACAVAPPRRLLRVHAPGLAGHRRRDQPAPRRHPGRHLTTHEDSLMDERTVSPARLSVGAPPPEVVAHHAGRWSASSVGALLAVFWPQAVHLRGADRHRRAEAVAGAAAQRQLARPRRAAARDLAAAREPAGPRARRPRGEAESEQAGRGRGRRGSGPGSSSTSTSRSAAAATLGTGSTASSSATSIRAPIAPRASPTGSPTCSWKRTPRRRPSARRTRRKCSASSCRPARSGWPRSRSSCARRRKPTWGGCPTRSARTSRWPTACGSQFDSYSMQLRSEQDRLSQLESLIDDMRRGSARRRSRPPAAAVHPGRADAHRAAADSSSRRRRRSARPTSTRTSSPLQGEMTTRPGRAGGDQAAGGRQPRGAAPGRSDLPAADPGARRRAAARQHASRAVGAGQRADRRVSEPRRGGADGRAGSRRRSRATSSSRRRATPI